MLSSTYLLYCTPCIAFNNRFYSYSNFFFIYLNGFWETADQWGSDNWYSTAYVSNQLFVCFLVAHTGQNLSNFGLVSDVTLNNTMVYVHCNDSNVISRLKLLPFNQKTLSF